MSHSLQIGEFTQKNVWEGDMWRPFVKNNGGYLIPGNKPYPPQFYVPSGVYEITGSVLLDAQKGYYTSLTARFLNVTGFHFSLRDKPSVVKVAQWFGSDVGVEWEDSLLNQKMFLQADDVGLARKVFMHPEVYQRLHAYQSPYEAYWETAGRIEINPRPFANAVSQLRLSCSGVLVGGLQVAVDLMGLILQRMTDTGTARPL